MRIFLILVSMLMLVSSSAYALTFEEAVTSALNSDDSIKQSKYLMESRKYDYRATFAGFLPTAALSYQHTDSELKFDTLPKINDAEESLFSVNINYNIFNGFYDWKNFRIGSKSYDIQKNAYDSKTQDVMLNVKKAYISYLKAMKNVDVAEETLKLLETQKNIAEVSYKIGQFSKADVLRVDVQLANTQLQLLDAQIALKLAKQELEKYIGRLVGDDEVVADIKVREDYNIPPIETLYEMLEDRSDMLAAKDSYDVANLSKHRTVSGFLPKVSLGYSYAWYGDEYSPFDGRPSRSASDYEELGAFIISASWNVFSGFYDYHSYRSQSMNAEASAYAVSDTRKNLRLQLSSYYENYFSSKERLAVATVAVEQARESYRVVQSQYANSEATTTDLLDASVALNTALTSQYAAKYDIILAVSQIERAVEANLLGIETNIEEFSE